MHFGDGFGVSCALTLTLNTVGFFRSACYAGGGGDFTGFLKGVTLTTILDLYRITETNSLATPA